MRKFIRKQTLRLGFTQRWALRMGLNYLYSITPEEADALLDKTRLSHQVRAHVSELIKPR